MGCLTLVAAIVVVVVVGPQRELVIPLTALVSLGVYLDHLAVRRRERQLQAQRDDILLSRLFWQAERYGRPSTSGWEPSEAEEKAWREARKAREEAWREANKENLRQADEEMRRLENRYRYDRPDRLD